MLGGKFMASIYQSRRADHKTTSSTSFRPMTLTLNDINRDRVKQHKKQIRAFKLQRLQKFAQNYPPTQGPYSVEKTQQATRHIFSKQSRRGTNTATDCTYQITKTEN